jgi:hypothetical protein
MKMRSISLALMLVAASASGQDYQAMMQSMEEAKASASKPGDDKLTCEQLEEQLVAVTQDPEFLAHVDAAGADAQKKQAAMDAAKGQIAMQTLRAALMVFVPGGAYPGMASAQSQAKASGMKGMAQMKDRMAQAQQMAALMPKLMRGQRVVELASAKSCEWAAGAGTSQ